MAVYDYDEDGLSEEGRALVGRILETQTRMVLIEKTEGEILEHLYICEAKDLCLETSGKFYYRNKDEEDELGSEWIFLCKNHSKGRKRVRNEQ